MRHCRADQPELIRCGTELIDLLQPDQCATTPAPSSSPRNSDPGHPSASGMSSEARIWLYFLLLASFLYKFLLFPAEHSTDLDVHRHWKTLTVSRPLSQWYVDESSQWTLDYPPLFAYFEYATGKLLGVVHPAVVNGTPPGDGDGDEPWRVVYWLRATVLALDPLLALCAYRYIATFLSDCSRHVLRHFALLGTGMVLLNPSLIIVDTLHFQYNLLPLSFLFLALSALQTSFPLAAALFAVAVNLKHTLFPLAIPLVVHVLSSLYQTRRGAASTSAAASDSAAHPVAVLVRTALATLAALALPWLPFAMAGGAPLLARMRDRLFPFDRGLLHANWAPNFWAFYAAADKALSRLFGCNLRSPDVLTSSGHIGGHRPFVCLPNPTPPVCFTLLVVATTPALVRLARAPGPLNVARSVVVAALAAVLFGWHVHEKAMLVALLPMAALCVASHVITQRAQLSHRNQPEKVTAETDSDINTDIDIDTDKELHTSRFNNSLLVVAFLQANAATNLAVLDLVNQHASLIFGRFHSYAYAMFAYAAFNKYITSPLQHRGVRLYACLCVVVELYANGGGHRQIFGTEAMQFLPKMIVSLYAFVGVASSFIALTFVD